MDHPQSGLSRYLSRLDVWALSLSCIIGWGAFVMPGTTFLPIAGPAGPADSPAQTPPDPVPENGKKSLRRISLFTAIPAGSCVYP